MTPFGFLAAVIPADVQCGILAAAFLAVAIGVIDLTRTTREPAEAWTRPRRRRKGVRR